MSFFADGINCQAITSDFDCISASVIYRIMLSLFLFGLIMLALLSTCSQRVGQILNEGLFFTKFVVCLLIFLGTLQLGDSILVNFSQFAQVFSYLFILWQVLSVSYSDSNSDRSLLFMGYKMGAALFLGQSVPRLPPHRFHHNKLCPGGRPQRLGLHSIVSLRR